MNSAGAALQDAAVVRAVVSHLELECAIGGYAAATRSANDARHQLAWLLNCSGGEIGLFESAQAAWSRAVYSLDLRKGDRIVCFEMEYAGNAVAFLQIAQRTGATVEVLPFTTPCVPFFEAYPCPWPCLLFPFLSLLVPLPMLNYILGP
jgi:selenocysteine lyase/cysteine desulfurase